MSRIFNDGRLYDGDKPGRVGKRIDYRTYPKMNLPIDAPLPYLIGVHEAMRFILSTDLQAVPLSAAEASERVAELIEAKLHDMEENV